MGFGGLRVNASEPRNHGLRVWGLGLRASGSEMTLNARSPLEEGMPPEVKP